MTTLHPSWCHGDHAPGTFAHTGDIGEIEFEPTGDLVLEVALFKATDTAPTRIQLIEHTHGDKGVTRVLGLSVDESLQLRDLIIEATTLALQEIQW